MNSPTSGNETLSYCGQEVRRHDSDRFLACHFAPAERREALFALYAFNIEIAKVAEVVSQPMLGQIRLQWWRECLEEMDAGRLREHAVARGLDLARREQGLSLEPLQRLIDAREGDLEEAPPADLAALEDYARATTTPLQEATLALVAPQASNADRAVAADVAATYAIAGLLRAVPFHASQSRLLLPANLLGAAKVDPHDVFMGREIDALRPVVEEVAQRAETILSQARARRGETSRAALPALLPARQAEGYLKQLRRAGFNPFDARVQRRDPAGAWRLLLGRLTRRY